MVFIAIAFIVLGVHTICKGRETIVAASMTYDIDEKKALLRAGTRRKWLGRGLVGLGCDLLQ